MTGVNDLYEITPSGERITFTPEIIRETVDCHLRPDKKRKAADTELCRFCVVNKLLQQYEEVLFQKDLAASGKQKNWQPSEQELIITGLVRLANTKLKHLSDALQDGETFLKMIELQKKEFRELRKAWTYLEAQLCANDELVICKTRLQLKDEQEEGANGPKKHRVLRQLSNEIANNLEHINELSEHEVSLYFNVMLNVFDDFIYFLL